MAHRTFDEGGPSTPCCIHEGYKSNNPSRQGNLIVELVNGFLSVNSLS